jgi:transcriptional regulator with XRE-family HTH domain
MIFETKKVPLETLGEYLAAVRQSLQLSVADVEQKTGICDKYLLNLEAGSYHQLPPDVYVLGFLKKLADLYSIPHDVLLSQYKKEREIINNVAHKVIAPDAGWKTKLSGLVITPKMITLTGGISLALIAVFYLIFQVLMINRTPSLKIAEPSAGSVVNGSAVSVIGVTDPGSTVAINGQNVFVDSEGNFRTTLGTAAGQKELVVTSQNKFGKKAEEKILVMVEAIDVSWARCLPSTYKVTEVVAALTP